MITKGGQKLNLSNKDLCEDSPNLDQYFKQYPQITELDITNNQFKTYPPEFLKWKSLITLDIRNNPFENFDDIVDQISNYPSLTDLKIDLTDHSQVLMLFKQAPQLLLLNGNSTKEAVTIVDLDEKDVEAISLQNELPTFNEMVMKLNDLHKTNSIEFIDQYQAKLNNEAAKLKSSLDNNVPNYIYATNVIQSHLLVQKHISQRFVGYLKTNNEDEASLANLIIASLFKSSETIIEILTNLYPKIEDKIDTLRNQLEDALKAADEISDYEEKFKAAHKEKMQLIKQFDNEKSIYINKIERLETENKVITDKLLHNAKEIINSNINRPMLSKPNITASNIIPPNTNTIPTNNNQFTEVPNSGINFTNTNTTQVQGNSNNNISHTQINRDMSNQNNNMNMNMNMNINNTSSGQSTTKMISLKIMKDLMNEIYASKEDYDKKCFDSRLPRETMEQHMYTYLNQKYGLKNLIIEWAASIIHGIKMYSNEDSDVNLFGKILRNEQEEDSRYLLTSLRTTIAEVLEYYLKSKNHLKSLKDIKKMVEAKKEGLLSQEEWKGIIYWIYHQEDATNLEGLINVYISKTLQMNSSNMNVHYDKKMTREEMNKLNKTKEEMNISYKDFVKLLGDFQIKEREKYLRSFVKIFRKYDKDCDGILDENEFVELVKMIPDCRENIDFFAYEFLGKIDPYNNKRITFSECVSLFESQTVNGKDDQGNPVESNLIERMSYATIQDQ